MFFEGRCCIFEFMNHINLLLIIILVASCTNKEVPESLRRDFSNEEQKIIIHSKKIIKEAYFGTLITIDNEGQPRARVMEPFTPDENFIIWLATNPKSRKVAQIEKNSLVTLHYYDKANFGYVSLMGSAYLINDESIKASKFKEGWDQFYKNQKEDYLLIKFIPKTLELISIPNKFTGDSITWKPHQVLLR